MSSSKQSSSREDANKSQSNQSSIRGDYVDHKGKAAVLKGAGAKQKGVMKSSDYMSLRSGPETDIIKRNTSQLSVSISVTNQSGRGDLPMSPDQDKVVATQDLVLHQEKDGQSQPEVDQVTLSLSQEQVFRSKEGSAMHTQQDRDSNPESPGKTSSLGGQGKNYASAEGLLDDNKERSVSIKDGQVDIRSSNVLINETNYRPISHHQPLKKNASQGGGKKRVKSTRPGGIRGGVLVQDKYGKAPGTPQQHMKSRAGTHMKGLNRPSSMKRTTAMAIQSTNAASSTQQASSTLYKSYAPTSLLKVGTRSVQRLRPRIPDIKVYSDDSMAKFNGIRPTTAVRPSAQFDQRFYSTEYGSSLNNLSSTQGAGRPRSQFASSRGRAGFAGTITAQNFASQRQNSNQDGVASQQIKVTDENPLMTTEAGGQTQTFMQKERLDTGDGFKLVSQFENEDAALEYAKELQKYYEYRNIDVKVQVEANLANMDDTADRQYLQEAYNTYQQKVDNSSQAQSEFQQNQSQSVVTADNKRVQRLNIRNAYKSHFKMNDPVQVRSLKGIPKKNTEPAEKLLVGVKKEAVEYNKLSVNQIAELRKAQEQIFQVIENSTKLPELSYKNIDLKARTNQNQTFSFQKGVNQTQIQHRANQQAQLLQKLGVLPQQLTGEVPHASQVMSADNKIPKSRAKFYQRERKLKKMFDAQITKWANENSQIDTNQQQQSQISAGQGEQGAAPDIDIRLYKERDDDYCIIGNKLQFRASEQNEHGRNYINKQALQTKGNFDPIRIRLRIMPISRAPLAQGKTPEFYFLEAAKKSLSGDLTSALELLKRGLNINPNHFICRFNHGVLMFKFGLIKEAADDFEMLTTHMHGRRDPWVFYNFATCLIQLGRPSRPIYEQEKEKKLLRKASLLNAFSMAPQGSTNNLPMFNSLNASGGAVGSGGASTSNKASSSHSVVGDSKKKSSGISNQLAQLWNTVTAGANKDFGTECYQKAIKNCEKAIEVGGTDKEIIMDAYNLKGICLFRLGQLIDAVKALYKARKIQKKIEQEAEERRLARIKKDKSDEVVGFFTRKDLERINKKRSNSYLFDRHRKMRKQKHAKVKRDLSWTNFELNDQRQRKESAQHETQSSSSSEEMPEAVTTTKPHQVEAIQEVDVEEGEESKTLTKSAMEYSDQKSRLEATTLAFDKSVSELEKATSKALSRASGDGHSRPDSASLLSVQNRDDDKSQPRSKQTRNTSKLSKERPSSSDANTSKVSGRKESHQTAVAGDEEHVKFRFAMDQLENANKAVIENDVVKSSTEIYKEKRRQDNRDLIKKALLKKLAKVQSAVSTKKNIENINELMAKMQKQSNEMAADRKRLRLSKEQYSVFRKFYNEKRKESDAIVDKDEPNLRLKNIYLRQFDENEEKYEDCNFFEICELKKRKAINQWIEEDDFVQYLIKEQARIAAEEGPKKIVNPVEQDINVRFVEKLLSVAKVNLEEVDGTHIETLLDIIDHQSQMDGIMSDLREKVAAMCHQFEMELNRGKEDLNAQCPKLDEMKILRGEHHIDVEDETSGHEDKMITRLRDALKSDALQPDEVINALTASQFEKEKMRLQLQFMNGQTDSDHEDGEKCFVKRKQIAQKRINRLATKQDMRYSERHIEQIRNQFKLEPSERNYKVLDILMRHLRYIKRHDADVRLQIYKNAEYVEYPAQHAVFKKGDEPDYMYIILKGKVSVESTLSQYSDIQLILSTLKDGEVFGEVALVDRSRVSQDEPHFTKQTMSIEDGLQAPDPNDTLNKEDAQAEKPSTGSKRMATCKTIEVTRAIRILAKVGTQIIQPTLKKEQEYSTATISLAPSKEKDQTIEGSQQNSIDAISRSEPKDYMTDELNKRLTFLQQFQFFRDIKRNILCPVALNLQIVQFKYGEFLTRSGEVPPGMFLILSGQCIVGLSQTSTRPKNYHDIPGLRAPVIDKHPLFNEFDPENSLLNNVEMQDRIFQNGRIYIDTNGKQIKNKIEYHNFLVFSQLFPKHQFGGRCLLPFEMYLQLKRIYFGTESLRKPSNEPMGDMKSEQKYQMQSFLDVVADSAIVECYMLTKQAINYLSDQYLKSVFEDIVQETEPDRPFQEDRINEKKKEMLESQAAHMAIVERIKLENKIEKYGVMAVKEAK